MKLAATAFGLALLVATSTSSAWPQSRDYFLDPPRPGTFVHTDVFTVGAQASLEKRVAIEDESTGMFHARASTLASLGYAEVAAHTDLRLLGLFTFGGSVGYRRVWNNFSLDDNSRENRAHATKKDAGGDADVQKQIDDRAVEGRVRSWAYAEGRGRIVVPLDRLWLVMNGTLRWEQGGEKGMPYNSFDWFHTNVHDPGVLYKLDATLFVRHSLGALGPTVRYMDLPTGGDAKLRKQETVFGLTFGTRPGFRRKDDLLLVQALFDFADEKHGKQFGWHTSVLAKFPSYIMVIYRISWEL